MNIRKVSTLFFKKEYKTQGSNPSQFNCSDKNEYVVKHARSGSYRPLINELIAVLLLNQLEIITPDFALVEINDEIFSPDYRFIRGKPNGLGFGSKFISNSKYVIDFSIIEKIMKKKKKYDNTLSETLLKIAIFDIWLLNADRNLENTNLLHCEIDGRISILPIDHCSIFNELSYNLIDKEIDEILPEGSSLFDSIFLDILFKDNGLFLSAEINKIISRIEGISERIIHEILDSIPNEWGITDSDKKSVLFFLEYRKVKIKQYIAKYLNF